MANNVSDEEVNEILKILADHAQPNSRQPFSNFNDAVRLLFRALLECRKDYPDVQADAKGKYTQKMLAALDQLNAEKAIYLDANGKFRQGVHGKILGQPKTKIEPPSV